jgi:hypothetical protein
MAACALGKAQSTTFQGQYGNSAGERNLSGKQTPPEILARNRKAIAVIVAAESESARLGTGFFVGGSDLLLTNLHVVEGAATVGIKVPEAGRVLPAAKARGYDLDNDLVVLQVDGANAQSVSLGDSDRVYSGQPIVVVGNPEGLEQTVSNGLISGIRNVDGRKLFQISAPVSEGSSGSPVFDEQGEVIGVVVSSLEKGQNLNFAVPINLARSLLAWPTERPISSLPMKNRLEPEAGPSRGVAPAGAAPSLGETLKWLVEKIAGAGYHYCQFQKNNLVCDDERYESVQAGDCKLTFNAVGGWSAARGVPFSMTSTKVLSLWSSSPDISVSSVTFQCDKGCRDDTYPREVFFVGRPRVAGIYFESKDLADRVAKAMNHAITLCGKEPF